MSIVVFLINNLRNIPPSYGVKINKIPFSLRPGLGTIYKKRKLEIDLLEKSSIPQKQMLIFSRIKALTEYSYLNVPFYKEFYDKNGFYPGELQSFPDIQKIPIVTKAILNEYNIEQRSAKRPGRYIVNTGGSSGIPFGFYIEPGSLGHEWAHMHHIWEKLGYKISDLKLDFSGRSDLKKEAVEYDVVRNNFAFDIYADYKLVAKRLKEILKKHKIKYLLGYPSSIYDFAVFCENEDEELRYLLSNDLVGALFGSEYPYPYYREVIESTFDIKTVSWYGHTERCVLAYEKNEKFVYEPFVTYGFAEAITTENEHDFQLTGSSYYNFASPLIRYNTEDIISDVDIDDGVLNSFKIKKGRAGEFVIDKTGKKINLTGLIFGRHHKLFYYTKFIQVKQIVHGAIEIHFVSNTLSAEKASEFFDKNNLELDIKFVKREGPFRTSSGKINLLIK